MAALWWRRRQLLLKRSATTGEKKRGVYLAGGREVAGGWADAREPLPGENVENSSCNSVHNSDFSTIRAGRTKYIPFCGQFYQITMRHVVTVTLFFPYSLYHDILPQKFRAQAEPQGALPARPQVKARPARKTCRLCQARQGLPFQARPPYAPQAEGGRTK